MKSLKQDLQKRLLGAISIVALIQWAVFVTYHLIEYMDDPSRLLEEIEEVSILFGIFCLGLPMMIYTTVRISRLALQPLVNLSAEAARVDTSHTEIIELDDVYNEIHTLRLAINQALKRYRGSLDQARRFGGDASHQLRTPLAVVRSGCEVALSRPRSAEEYQAVLGQVLEEVEHLESTIQQLQLLARIDRGENTRAEEVSTENLLEAVRDRMEPVAEAKGVTLTLRPKSSARFPGNPILIEESLVNLLDNAIHAAGKKGQVDLEVQINHDSISFALTDSGPGMPAGQREHIFGRFHRGPKTEYEGSGLGLSIALAIAEMHGGSLTLNDPSPPTCFILTLPLSKSKTSP